MQASPGFRNRATSSLPIRDSFSGGSGGSLFNTALELIGHQVRGLPDWAFDGSAGDRRRGDEPSEEHQLIAISVAALCDTGWPSARLCDTAACGDGVCSGSENATDCSTDCDPPSCGDGFCEQSERFVCAMDCEAFHKCRSNGWKIPNNIWYSPAGKIPGAPNPTPHGTMRDVV